jgi:hypothetical protein
VVLLGHAAISETGGDMYSLPRWARKAAFSGREVSTTAPDKWHIVRHSKFDTANVSDGSKTAAKFS